MRLLNTLTACLFEDELRTSTRKALLQTLMDYQSNGDFRSLFSSLINLRREEVLKLVPDSSYSSLCCLYQSEQYLKLVEIGGIPTLYADKATNEQLERVAIKHFGSLSEMWAHTELACIKEHQLESFEELPDMPFLDDEYEGLLVNNIKSCSLVVSSPHKAGTFSLSNAIYLANIELFVLEQRWFEMLPLLKQASENCHFILIHKSAQSEIPCLAASAMITDWTRHDKWLSFTPFFQHSHWVCELSAHSINLINQTGAFKSLSQHVLSVEMFDGDCVNKVSSPSSVCEILRLTTSGKKMQRLYLLYLAQKKMAECLSNSGYQCAYTIIDNPWLLNFYAQLGSNTYIDTGSYTIDNQSRPTFRGMWLVEQFHLKYSSIDFRQYKQMAKNSERNQEVSNA
ncbi:N-(3-hydroxybutanoyl)-L- homoserine lactone synthase LuxM [Vibrio sp. RE86]|uniref:acyl-homoserine-lactone synthase n=1 Tax=Vibrio sp. RE86 TaxID=2607605 RepID=UPI00149392E1|nr:acyl-homoserine-lactone synthase [Vibrio sp. RE86]NOH81599.1 N-(3-hydroxybutanoyl)-L- homoserine lactone synthase LuxM [Vibrio sp. RE86]